jgi:nucleoside-diphosphate-sugar epimerase
MTTGSQNATRPVLVTGAMGLLGRRVVEVLLGRGHSVVALDVRNSATEATAASLSGTANDDRRFVPAWVDLLDPESVGQLVEQHSPVAIIHLAAAVSPACYRNPSAARAVNVDGTRHLVAAAVGHVPESAFVLTSSAAVNGSRNPYRNLGRVTPATPINPIDCYGEQKAAAEEIVMNSGLPRVILRLGGIMSADQMTAIRTDLMMMARITPRDGRVHMVDARDAATACTNAVDRIESVHGTTFVIGGDESHVLTHGAVQDDCYAAVGLGRIGPSVNRPGNPDDDNAWGLTDWFDTTESQRALGYQDHRWDQTMEWIADSLGSKRQMARLVGPIGRSALRAHAARENRRDGIGQFADPWMVVRRRYGAEALASSAVRGARGMDDDGPLVPD